MKKWILFLAFGFVAACKTLQSQTFIEPQQSFMLGEGTHGSFKASIKNTGTENVEISKESADGSRSTVAVLAPGDATRVKIADNTKVIFKNTGAGKATLRLSLTGDTGLSMATKSNE
jgi:hypothetical protein